MSAGDDPSKADGAIFSLNLMYKRSLTDPIGHDDLGYSDTVGSLLLTVSLFLAANGVIVTNKDCIISCVGHKLFQPSLDLGTKYRI